MLPYKLIKDVTPGIKISLIKHSGSDKMALLTGVIDKHVFIDIIDYGRGFSLSENSQSWGRGLKNMQYRAR